MKATSTYSSLGVYRQVTLSKANLVTQTETPYKMQHAYQSRCNVSNHINLHILYSVQTVDEHEIHLLRTLCSNTSSSFSINFCGQHIWHKNCSPTISTEDAISTLWLFIRSMNELYIKWASQLALTNSYFSFLSSWQTKCTLSQFTSVLQATGTAEGWKLNLCPSVAVFTALVPQELSSLPPLLD